ncbi:MAG: 23S rRNA methyltransferase [Microbacterium sp. 71-36]|uniref:class I SAM-dependent RNA methyltransferase n=1 Tax=unclassified Microbacterium TaxID=2609290 RepID=UPI00086DC38A|nr:MULTISPECIES: TRAM domain-containing protein [unclassified Microbacterium]MBN9210107.1 class I SAM-dependent RNA methyltransferase [Microbacterium sp.]ODT36285.1 MAG: 23S rRNA methyltransferase [Microbacterium sp. SCN 71-17]OJV76091.1 MAG: 23S rRNA methyltransferase [Microbacterium sp. 71-36]
MQNGDLIDLDITGVAHGGIFVGRHEGRVVFVPDTLPGERVRVRLTDTRKKAFWRAEALEVLDAAPERRPHVWPSAAIDRSPDERVGGAEFGHIELGQQRLLKERVIRESLERVGRLELPVSVRPAGDDETSDGTRWRTRVSLHVDEDGRVGPFAPRSHRVVETPDLPLATDAIARAAADLRGAAPGRIDLVQPADGRVRVLPRPDGAPATGTVEVVEERVGDRVFRVDAGGFWQVHRLAAGALTEAVADRIRSAAGELDPDAVHLDLYGGVGLFAAALADIGGASTRVVSVESDARATEHAGENLAEWVGARAETARVDRYVARLRADASERERERISRGVVVLDPPRAGAGREVVEGIAGLDPRAVVYVACDPVALARDLATFAVHGYRVDGGVHGLDLFPHSHHVEAVVALRR